MDESNFKYVEHRIFFLGHIIDSNQKCDNNNLIKFKNYSFDYYGEHNKIEINCNKTKREINLMGLRHLIECKKVKYSFLNNGCVSIVIKYNIKNKDFFKKFEEIGGENFENINQVLFERIKCFLKEDLGIGLKKYLKFNKVVDYRSKIFFQENDIVDTAVYSQHFFYEKENKIFESAFKKQNKIFEKVLEELEEQNKKSENKSLFTRLDDDTRINVDWGYRIWIVQNKKEITNLLDNEIVFLSKQCLMNSQVIISTQISKKLLYESRFKQNIDQEDLEDFICNYRTFHHLNDLITMDFDKDTKKINDQFFKYDEFDNLIESKNDCEETILRLLNNYESKSTRNARIVLSILLVTISVLTLFSVFNDLNALNKDYLDSSKKPYINIPLTISLIFAITTVVSLFLYTYRRSLKKFLNEFFANKI
ncbi:hypothetical protein [Aliarcobacter cryaerophilus]|jgi:hypothetical protein|uniref:hypothetical protein n=1 Tax=Aliarcobacter cryaerophilus TaxID=28198 RepID=UPI000834F042|nr:hypothetical protein [Aliarcobacter cryaerophilus]MCT7514944.1 hypothetical protein [Aliarcobacter cryaerophilus]